MSGGGASSRLKAFTLAEVLITLAIIGVVAALTIPSVISNYKKTEIETGIKKSFSTISTAFNMAVKDYGPSYTWVVDGSYTNVSSSLSEAYFDKFIVPYLKIAKQCGKSTETECTYDILALGGGEFDYSSEGAEKDHFARYYLTDGTSITAYMTMLNGAPSQMQLYVDVNGWKKPNQMGIDIQFFTFRVSKKTSDDSNKFGYQIYTSGKSEQLQNITDQQRGCYKPDSPTNGIYGSFCATLLKRNGWKIPSVDEYVQMAGGDESYRAKYPWNF
ncbi:MAG: type II secretion system protein [Cyanobacteria bacterium SIG30]|nr:type II secretion system protein [Cyanobacteria bacterium SIG30]